MRRHLATLAALLLFTGFIQAWCVQHAVVPAQDAVRYVSLAQGMQEHGILAVVRATHDEPLFPLLVYGIHAAGAPLGFPGGLTWLSAVQLTAAAAAVLTIIPLYGLMLCFVPWRAAMAGGVFYGTLASLARLGADGLADSTHLLLFTTAMYLACVAWKRLDRLAGGADACASAGDTTSSRSDTTPGANPSPNSAFGSVSPIALGCLIAGVVVACAAMARAEAQLLLPAWFLVLLCPAAWRAGRRRANLVAAVSLVAGYGAVMLPYLYAAETPSLQMAALRLAALPTNAADWNDLNRPDHEPLAARRLRTSSGERLSFERKDPETSLRRSGWLAACKEFLKELPGAFQYWVGALAVLGLAVMPASGRNRLADRFVWSYWMVYGIAIVAAASQLGYLATRHVLPLVVLGLAAAGLGAMTAGDWLAACWARRRKPRPTSARDESILNVAPSSALNRRRAHNSALAPTATAHFPANTASWAVVAAVAAICLVRTLPPLHAGREPHRQAAEWIAAQHPPGRVLDTRGWTGLITGRETYTYERAPLAWGDPHLAFVVLEQHELNHNTARSRTLAQLLQQAGETAAVFPNPGGDAGKSVAVYRWYPERLSLAGQTVQRR